ncbi:predicted protein [Sclerotinia sclerotiorum 1980 UF-70]|uniref:Uncharacterized protein n=1 Tax=Sclerotinia sclerotiorum (strain ATCC 18683 / 1980 / Ss-1) TaxID=665079 RepID=A7F5R3_SCLS1|nr:predicted protein [Sclerotinia sclerotiorum 1980 UF-70]EDN98084.1 predicted protein [Sclerotinia sclerotiorum 1980 UF-70]
MAIWTSQRYMDILSHCQSTCRDRYLPVYLVVEDIRLIALHEGESRKIISMED